MAALLASAVDAQAPTGTPRADSTGRSIPAVRVSASRVASLVGGAAAVVVDPQEVRASPAPLLEQVLRESPFVLVRQNSRGEMELSVRGSDSRQAAVLFDGVPLTLGWDHRTDPSLIPLTGSERLVIVRGLGSLLNGPNTLGGTIEITHDAYGQPARGAAWAGVGVDQYRASVASLGYGKRLAEFGGGALSMRVGGAHRQREGFKLPGGAPDATAIDGLRTGSDFNQTDGFGSLRWNNRAGRSVALTYTAYGAERGVPPEEHISGPRFWRYPYARRQVAMLSANTGVFRSRLGTGSLEVGVGRNDSRFKIATYSTRAYTTQNGQELGDERTTSLRALLSHSLGPATLRASWTAADVQYEEVLNATAPADYRQRLGSAGAEVEVPLGSRTQLAGGVVADRSSTPETGGRTPGQAPFARTGWRTGITHTVSDRMRLHASASQRSRFPALRELYSGALSRFTPNPALTPETLLGIEAGVTMSNLVPALAQSSLQVIGFRHRLDDAVVRITLSSPTRLQRVNRDRIDSHGVELLGGFVFGADPARSVALNGDATIQRLRVADQLANGVQRRAENNPEVRGRLELSVPLPARIAGVATARHVGTQFCLNGDTGRQDQLPARTVGDVGVQRSFAVGQGLFRSLRALVSLDNVGNVAVYDQCGLPQPGRTLRVMVGLR